jgi:hypothetical protein
MSVTSSEFNDDLKGIAAGLGFAAAYAWITVFKVLVDRYIHLDHESFMYNLIMAVLVTMLSIFIFILVRNETKRRARKSSSNR